MNLKGYVHHWDLKETAQERDLEYSFDSSNEDVATWASKEEAEIDCRLFDRQNIRIPSALGGYHICSGFKCEERSPGTFVVYCEAPFIRRSASVA
jgi:hypothetical protein